MDDDCPIGIMFKDRTYLGFDVNRSFGSHQIFPTGKLTTTNASNAGHLCAASDQNSPEMAGFSCPADMYQMRQFFKAIIVELLIMPRPSTFDATHGVWVRPNFSLNYNRREISWTGRNGRDADSPRVLELADIALGIKKPNKKRASLRCMLPRRQSHTVKNRFHLCFPFCSLIRFLRVRDFFSAVLS